MAIKYIPYFPNTVSGQAILDNFVRTRRILRYRESDKVTERIIRGMPLYEVTEQERVGNKDSDNMIIHGECVSACAYLKEQGIKVDLVYIDPPFASGADYAKKIYIRRNPLVAKAIQEAERELEDEELKAFEEKMYGDIWDKEKYLNWMYENLMAIRSVMSENASIYVHLDWHIVHYVKILMDEIFGEDNFCNDITWHYSGWNKKLKNSFEKRHDTILYYSFDKDGVSFNSYFEQWESEDEYVRRRKQKVLTDSDGRKYVLSDAGNGNRIKRYIDEAIQNGVVVDDVWDLDKVNNSAREGVGYATQKPETLLERIIKASSNDGMLVADFFGGSGVTAAVAAKFGRKFIHSDVNINSIQTARDRLIGNGASFSVKRVQDGVTLYRNPIQTKDAITRIIPGLRVDPTIGSMWIGTIMDMTYGASPVYVPDLMDSTSRVLDVVTLNRIINDAMPQLPLSTKRVIIFYIDVIDRQELDDFIMDNNDTIIEIELRDLKELLDNAILQDEVEYTLTEDTTKLIDIFTVAITRFYSDRVGHKINEFNQKAMASTNKKYIPIELSQEGLEAIEMVSLDCTTVEPNAPWHSDSEIKIEKNSAITINGHKTSDFWDGTIHSDTKPLRMKIRNICGDETIITLAE